MSERRRMMMGIKEIPVNNGLLFYLDGIENTSNGEHSSNPTYWYPCMVNNSISSFYVDKTTSSGGSITTGATGFTTSGIAGFRSNINPFTNITELTLVVVASNVNCISGRTNNFMAIHNKNNFSSETSTTKKRCSWSMSSDNCWFWRKDTNTYLTFSNFNGSANKAIYVFTWSDSTMKGYCYKDGTTYKNSGTYTFETWPSTFYYCLGCSWYYYGYTENSCLAATYHANVAYNRALSDDEVAKLMRYFQKRFF